MYSMEREGGSKRARGWVPGKKTRQGKEIIWERERPKVGWRLKWPAIWKQRWAWRGCVFVKQGSQTNRCKGPAAASQELSGLCAQPERRHVPRRRLLQGGWARANSQPAWWGLPPKPSLGWGSFPQPLCICFKLLRPACSEGMGKCQFMLPPAWNMGRKHGEVEMPTQTWLVTFSVSLRPDWIWCPESRSLPSDWPLFKTWGCHFLAAWHWTSDFSLLGLSFLPCKVGEVRIPTLWGCARVEWDNVSGYKLSSAIHMWVITLLWPLFPAAWGMESAFQSESSSKLDFTSLALFSSLSHMPVWEVRPPDPSGWARGWLLFLCSGSFRPQTWTEPLLIPVWVTKASEGTMVPIWPWIPNIVGGIEKQTNQTKREIGRGDIWGAGQHSPGVGDSICKGINGN